MHDTLAANWSNCAAVDATKCPTIDYFVARRRCASLGEGTLLEG
ncbi:MAG TPA: hypothetical protein VMV53_05745 [Acidimicrobiales bacterium]|nr:hypothetical protein [Acidimicrobiales bacterium]